MTEVLRFMETRDKATGKRDSTLGQIMGNGGLYFKTMQKNGEQDNEQLQLLDGAVLRLGWSREKDIFVFQLASYVSPWKRKQPTGIILKVMLRRLFSKEYNLDWVDDLVKELHGQRMDVFKMLVRKVLELDSKGASKMGIPDWITSNRKDVEKVLCLFYSLDRRSRNKFNLGYYTSKGKNMEKKFWLFHSLVKGTGLGY